jgi:hypothetical protein
MKRGASTQRKLGRRQKKKKKKTAALRKEHSKKEKGFRCNVNGSTRTHSAADCRYQRDEYYLVPRLVRYTQTHLSSRHPISTLVCFGVLLGADGRWQRDGWLATSSDRQYDACAKSNAGAQPRGLGAVATPTRIVRGE